MTYSVDADRVSLGGERPRRWWVRPLIWVVAAVYLAQLTPFLFDDYSPRIRRFYFLHYPIVPGIVPDRLGRNRTFTFCL